MAAILLTDDTMSNPSTDYLLAGRAPELERRQLQSIVWEPAARELPTKLSPGTGLRAIDLGCGVMGWLRVLSAWVGDGGHVTGTDVDERMLAGAKDLVEREQLSNVSLVKDDLFDSQLPPHTVDLVHSRFQIAPLGRAEQQLAAYTRLLKPGGLLVVEPRFGVLENRKPGERRSHSSRSMPQSRDRGEVPLKCSSTRRRNIV